MIGRLPKALDEELHKAMGFMAQNSVEKAVACMIEALRLLQNAPQATKKLAVPKVKAFLALFAKHPRVALLLEDPHAKTTATIAYALGKERVLGIVLRGFLEVLQDQMQVTKEAFDLLERQKRKEHLFEQGMCALKEGKFRLGLAFFERMLTEFPDTSALCMEACQALYEANMVQESALYAMKVIAAFENLASAYTFLLDILMRLEAFDKAERVFQKALVVFGEHPKTLANMAHMYERWGKIEEARRVCERALTLDPDNSDLLTLKSRLYLAIHDHVGA
ncbi:MAG: hypothetical protein IJS54_01400 [Desulfovibrio sp.]|nr:hypothetical protein [Desulfovibrio sp.]